MGTFSAMFLINDSMSSEHPLQRVKMLYVLLPFILFSVRQIKVVRLVKRHSTFNEIALLGTTICLSFLCLTFLDTLTFTNIICPTWRHGISSIYTLFLFFHSISVVKLYSRWLAHNVHQNKHGFLLVVRAIYKSSGWGQCHRFTWCSLVMVDMTHGGFKAKATCTPHTSGQGGAVVSQLSFWVLISVLNTSIYSRDVPCLFLCICVFMFAAIRFTYKDY